MPKWCKTSRNLLYGVFYMKIGVFGDGESISEVMFCLEAVMTTLVVIIEWSRVVIVLFQ